LKKASAKVKDLYTESKNYKTVTPESQKFLDEIIKDAGQVLTEKIKEKVPNFRPDVWEKLTEAQKIEVINQQVGPVIAEVYGIKQPQIKYYEGPESSCGSFQHTENILNLNSNGLNNFYELANT